MTDQTPQITPLAALMSFCSHDLEARPFWLAPMSDGVHAYATDGYAAFMVPMSLLPEELELAKLPDFWLKAENSISTLIDTARKAGGDLVAPPPLPAPIRCTHCAGTGFCRPTDACNDCDGQGEFIHGCHYYDCQECHGRGTVERDTGPRSGDPCARCHGRGEETHNPTKIGSAYINRVFLALISALPNARIATPANANAPIYFTSDYGNGVVMPVRKGRHAEPETTTEETP